MNRKIFALLLIYAFNVEAATAQLLPFHQNNKVGYKDASGNTVVPPFYDAGSDMKDGRAVVLKGALRGYIDLIGLEVIPCQYMDASLFEEGLGCVQFGDKWGFINKDGAWIIQPVFDNAFSFSEGLARVLHNGKWGMINQQGTFIVAPVYERLFDLSDGLIGATLDGVHYGYLDSLGKVRIEARYKLAMPFDKNTHRGIVTTSDGNYYINTHGIITARIENKEEEEEERERASFPR